MRSCKRCEYEGIIESFPLARTIGDKKYYRYLCHQCYTKQKLEQRAKRRDLLEQIKKEVECVRCGNSDWRVIDWHHVDPADKEFSIANATRGGYSLERIMAELDKCTPLCANCHRIVEYEIRHNISG